MFLTFRRRFLYVFAIPLLLLNGSVALCQSGSTADAYYQQAEALYNSKKYSDAAAALPEGDADRSIDGFCSLPDRMDPQRPRGFHRCRRSAEACSCPAAEQFIREFRAGLRL